MFSFFEQEGAWLSGLGCWVLTQVQIPLWFSWELFLGSPEFNSLAMFVDS